MELYSTNAFYILHANTKKTYSVTLHTTAFSRKALSDEMF